MKAGGFPGVRGPGRRPHPYWVAHQEFGRADFRELVRVLRQYDVVAPLDAFDEALLLTSHATGLPPLQEVEHAAVVPDPQGMGGQRLSDAEICPDMAACRAHIEAIAPWDHKLYRQVVASSPHRTRGPSPHLREHALDRQIR